MSQYLGYNSALSATTAIAAGASYAAGAKCALQLGIPSGKQIELIEWGITLDVAATTGALVEIASTATASTMTTAHTTTTCSNFLDPNGPPSGLTYSTTATGFGTGAITSNTTLRMADRLYVQSGWCKQWPLGEYPKFGATGAAQFLQFRINTAATVNAIIYMLWNEVF